jgi:hypothetical protein
VISRNELRKSLNLSQGSHKSLDKIEQSIEPKSSQNKIKKEINSFVRQLEKEKDFKNQREKSSSNSTGQIKISLNRNFYNISDLVYGGGSKNSDQSEQIEMPMRQSFDIRNSINKFYNPQNIQSKKIEEKVYDRRDVQNVQDFNDFNSEKSGQPTKLGSYLRMNRKNDATRNLRIEDEEEIGKHILTFSKPFETQTGKSSYRIGKSNFEKN